MKKTNLCIIAALGLFAATTAFADCAADATVAGTTRAHARGQQLEKSGDPRGALAAYVAAQEYTCDANPVAADAARRAAAVAKPLADAAQAKGDHDSAFDFYERGGYFAAADRELVALTQAQPDDPSLYARARQHFSYRALPAFTANEAVRLHVTGSYSLDPLLVKAVDAMPLKGVERALVAEAAAFNETDLAAYVAMIRSRPQNPADLAALQQFTARAQTFQAQHPGEPLRESLRALEGVRSWETQLVDNALAQSLAGKRAQRAEARAAALTQRYADAPALLAGSLDYLAHTVSDSARAAPRISTVRRQAESLGDAAAGKQQFQLAIEYYDIANTDAKADKARLQLQALAQQQMQPGIAAMQRDAAAMKAQFGDPKKVAEMQRQAQEAQRALQSSANARKTPAARGSAADMAKELGL